MFETQNASWQLSEAAVGVIWMLAVQYLQGHVGSQGWYLGRPKVEKIEFSQTSPNATKWPRMM